MWDCWWMLFWHKTICESQQRRKSKSQFLSDSPPGSLPYLWWSCIEASTDSPVTVLAGEMPVLEHFAAFVEFWEGQRVGERFGNSKCVDTRHSNPTIKAHIDKGTKGLGSLKSAINKSYHRHTANRTPSKNLSTTVTNFIFKYLIFKISWIFLLFFFFFDRLRVQLTRIDRASRTK